MYIHDIIKGQQNDLALLVTAEATTPKELSSMLPHDTPSWVARFWSKVNKTETCWLWTASYKAPGFGLFYIGEKCRLAHRLAYELTHGSIPDGYVVLHVCKNLHCVNPDHLFLRSFSDNASAEAARRSGEPTSRAKVVCIQCGREFEAYWSDVKRGRMRHCSTECRLASVRTHKTVEYEGKVYARHRSGYYIRTENGVVTRLHRVIWETHNGPIPSGHLIHHRDHNKENNDISNLELMEWGKHTGYHSSSRPHPRRPKSICNDPDCDRPTVAKGLCSKHYERKFRKKSTERHYAKIKSDPIAYRSYLDEKNRRRREKRVEAKAAKET